MTLAFSIAYEERLGGVMYVVGDAVPLGKWDVHAALSMQLRERDGRWVSEVALPRWLRRLEYKYVVLRGDGSPEWEHGYNRRIDLTTSDNRHEWNEEWRG